MMFSSCGLARVYFNPLSPRGERLISSSSFWTRFTFQSTLPAWGETTGGGNRGDPDPISIHSPRVGRDNAGQITQSYYTGFQSTLPAWGETFPFRRRLDTPPNFNPLSPRGERLRQRAARPERWYFNPLSPRGERRKNSGAANRCPDFNPLSPRGERLPKAAASYHDGNFNPLSPRGERQRPVRGGLQGPDFNPLSPRGERLSSTVIYYHNRRFQSTLPAWGETGRSSPRPIWTSAFQSTLPAWGETGARWRRRRPKIFQSTLPAWGETGAGRDADGRGDISIHSPRVGRD